MANDLVVPRGQVYRFDDEVDQILRPYVNTVAINTLNDLVGHGMIGSVDKLRMMLDDAKEVTNISLNLIQRTSDVSLVRGTRRVDLGRFRPFAVRASASNVSVIERDLFWRIFRKVPSNEVARFDLDTVLVFSDSLVRVVAGNVTVGAGATLQFAGSVQNLSCMHLLIENTGRIEVLGSGLMINATSIEGHQGMQLDISPDPTDVIGIGSELRVIEGDLDNQ